MTSILNVLNAQECTSNKVSLKKNLSETSWKLQRKRNSEKEVTKERQKSKKRRKLNLEKLLEI